MTKFFQLLVGCALTLTALTVRAEVLWWSTGEASDITVTYEGSTETTTAEELGATHVRIRYDDGEDYLPFVDSEGNALTRNGTTVLLLPAEEVWSDIGSTGAGRSFVVELGNWVGGDAQSWTVLASASVAYSSLLEGGHLSVPALELPAFTAWQATGFTAVPEPTSGLLTLLGLAVLALRRKRMS